MLRRLLNRLFTKKNNMIWITRHEYINLETGELTKTVNKTITIIKKQKHVTHGKTKSIITITNFYRECEFQQGKLY